MLAGKLACHQPLSRLMGWLESRRCPWLISHSYSHSLTYYVKFLSRSTIVEAGKRLDTDTFLRKTKVPACMIG
jgi:hypothetical protein